MYLIDTSIWIDFLRGSSNKHVTLLETLLEEGDAYLCEITYSEICFGARDDVQHRKYVRFFSELPFLKLPDNWHQQAAQMGYQLRKKGYKPFMGDLLIALAALTHQMPLLTRDNDFKPYQQIFGLSIE